MPSVEPGSYHIGTTFSPFYVMFLREPRVSLDLALNLDDYNQHYADINEYMDAVKQRMERAYGIVTETTCMQFDRMKKTSEMIGMFRVQLFRVKIFRASTRVTGKKMSATWRNRRKMTVFREDRGEGLLGPSSSGA